METEKKYALLIDADNVSPKYMDLVLRETKTLGDVSIRRIYGDWTEIGKHSWKECLLENSLTPIQQYSYTTGKNASDSAMIIDAMDILYTREIDGFVIVSSDSDFTKLAMRLRESGKYVVGMGESKTPSPFVKACDRFKTLDILMRSVEEIPKKGRNVGKSYYKRENNNIAEQSTETEGQESQGTQDNAPGGSLVVYFSWSGNTRNVAEEIGRQTGAGLFELVPATPYSEDYNTVLEEAQDEKSQAARPEISDAIEGFENYDVIYLGYPNWWGTMPMAMFSFLEQFSWR